VPAHFELPGVTNFQSENHTLRFFFKGGITTLLDRVHGLPLSDILIEEPTLEEIFMHYYE